jgi:hypothetical protein
MEALMDDFVSQDDLKHSIVSLAMIIMESENPHFLSMKDDEGRTAQHIISSIIAEEEVTPCCRLQDALEFLLDIFNKMGRDNPQDKDKGTIALHIACMHSKSAPTIQELARLYPEAVNTPVNQESTPLEHALERKNLPLQVYKTLLEACPLDGVLDECTTVVHAACEWGAPLEVFRLLVTRFPDTLRFKQGGTGFTPLHTAGFEGKVSAKVVELLINANPDALMEFDDDRETPLSACSNDAPSGVIQLLMKHSPQAVKMTNYWGCLPLHFARGNSDPNVMSQVYDLYPQAIRKMNDYDAMPLHVACRWEGTTKREIYFLAEKWPVACCLEETYHHRTPYDALLARPHDAKDQQAALDFMANATKNASCAMVECVLHPKSKAPPAVVQHVRDTILAALPVAIGETIGTMSSQRLEKSLRPLMNQDLLTSLVRNGDLQKLLKEDEPFQTLICGMVKMNQTDRYYFTKDPHDKACGTCVLDSVSNTLDCVFLHLRENPFLCEPLLIGSGIMDVAKEGARTGLSDDKDDGAGAITSASEGASKRRSEEVSKARPVETRLRASLVTISKGTSEGNSLGLSAMFTVGIIVLGLSLGFIVGGAY